MNIEALPNVVRQLTFDQIRTFVVLAEEGSPGKTATALGRDQSSVAKQIDKLNACFKEVCGEQLTTPRPGRGQEWVFTQTGELVINLCKETLINWGQSIEQMRRQVGRKLVIATTTFTLPVLALAWKQVVTAMGKHVDLRVEQIRTSEFWDKLLDRSVDVLVGGIVAHRGSRVDLPECDFLELQRDSLCLLTNLTEFEYSGKAIGKDALTRYNIILPDAGVILDAIRKWYGEDYRNNFLMISPIKDVHYGLGLLQLPIIRGFMVATERLARRFEHINDEAPTTSADQHKWIRLRKINFADDFEPLEIAVGLCARKGERQLYSKFKGHPLNVLWGIFESMAPNKV